MLARYVTKQAGKRAAKRAILQANRKAGIRAEKMAEAALKKKGYKVLGSQVSVRTAKGIRRIDHLVKTPRGKYLAVEVKSGNARRSKMQLAKDKLIRNQGGKFVGKKAPKYLRGTTKKMRTVVITPK